MTATDLDDMAKAIFIRSVTAPNQPHNPERQAELAYVAAETFHACWLRREAKAKASNNPAG